MSHAYRRTVTPAEWLYLGLPTPHDVQYVIEGTGALDAGDVRRAVAAASRACPGTRIVRRGKAWVDTGVAPSVHVIEGGPLDRRRPDHPALHSWAGDPQDTFEVLLFPGAPTCLVLRGRHAATDARGLALWGADVFRALRGEEPQGAPSPLNSLELMHDVRPQGLPPIPPAAAALTWPSPLGPVSPGARRAMWRTRTVSGRHPAATAKVAAALAAAYGPDGRGSFFVPVDLRRHSPGLRSTAWLSQALVLSVDSGESWEEVHRSLLSTLAQDGEMAMRAAPWTLRTPLPLLRLLSRAVSRAASRSGRYSALGFLTHLGAFDLADFSTAGFQATAMYTLGGVGPGTPPAVDLMDVGDHTEATVTWLDAPGVAERAEELLDTVEEALSPARDRTWPGNLTARPVAPTGLTELIRAQARSAPDAPALSGPEGEVTYRELDRRADAVAHALSRLGAGRGSVVGVLCDRTPEAIAGIWGVVRTGAAFLPLDPQHPDHRLADVLADAGVGHCLVQPGQDGRAAFPPGCTPLPLDELTQPVQDQPEFPALPARPDDLAYVIYTSGSTGRPKGVQIEHGSLLNYLHWAVDTFGIGPDSRLSLMTSLSFDVSMTSVFGPALTGGSIVPAPGPMTHLALRDLLERSGATMLNLTPSHLDLITQLDVRPEGFTAVIVTGEQLRVEVAAKAQRLFGDGCRIINQYGPTEATVGCTAHVFDAATDSAGTAVPIGLPGYNTTVHLLDDRHRFVAPGEVGEMYLGGVQLARGYLGRPDLDAQRFVRLADGTRVYRTGDLARLLPSGELTCLGRNDDQVKVRGHRVEPTEVARALERHHAVDRAVVVARTAPSGSGKALYAYVLTRTVVSTEELRDHAAALLPPYMVPSAVLTVSELPYTVSGKVDAGALPDPLAGSAPAAPSAIALADPVVQSVAQVWAEVLAVPAERLDEQADFHQLGGDSLALLSMLAGVGRTLLTEAGERAFMSHLHDIIEKPTLGHVAARVREAVGTGGELRESALSNSGPR
ncbi:non-ribosomal peptide synthetase [Streptomyces sp. NBC_00557]|uniref:non-ribosomal peptide synthetase n=1 Tax=Streptomyces sp. NBC_00557 TaxID=2975776 RepID=UPI002E810EB9|nr:non-ribosomal peptide synthetase [Streptomyces sp. NBC_00557]WUC39532.1 non-ribosomal peptide synthetase [Streptomyces sp. NBC_00557]